MISSRREFLQSSGLLLACAAGSEILMLTPREAYGAELPYEILSQAEADTLESLAELLVPGSKKAGVAHYVDKQLKAAPADSLLMLKYLGVPIEDFGCFYAAALASATTLASQRHQRPWSKLDADQGADLVSTLSTGEVKAWAGPPSPFFVFVLRADACDVVYGTEAGFAHLDVPYMAHIKPTQPW